ncbi:MAG: hypothetical protein M1814_002200 [Vezdaea aestivalis]|nr:MAG: hypothetical protein M1814_002200 [Vezdaea aestivalis]
MLANLQRQPSYPLRPRQHQDLHSPRTSNIPFYFDSSFPTSTPSPSDLAHSQYMPGSNPQVRIHQSSPAPALSENALSEHQWQYQTRGNQMWSTNAQYRHGGNKHHRASSGSSVGSGGPSSPYNQTTSNPTIVKAESSPAAAGYSHYDYADSSDPLAFAKSTYEQPQGPFVTAPFNTESMNDMRRAMNHALEVQSNHDDSPAFSGRRSVSSRGGPPSPQTPRSASIYEAESHDRQAPNGKPISPAMTTLEAFDLQLDAGGFHGLPLVDETYGYVSAPQQTASIRAQSHMLSPYGGVTDRIRAANNLNAGSQSPVSSSSRERSPFKHHSSPFAMSSDQFVKQSMGYPHDEPVQTTISPKDVELEFNEAELDAKTPLFSAEDATAFGSNPAQQAYKFNTPTVSGNVQVPQQYPFIAQPRRQQQSFHSLSRAEPTPDFPAHLTSMESTVSEEGVVDVQRPAHASADSGTYTCTYHGCTLRFESPAKLQKHKREGHRQTTPSQAATGMSASALLRNSQAGPHRCDRINPQTGKSCNTIFSRPYDLTRHEDTIHNARKQKVRCQFCAEDKTFSRNDALTRHMRVVHPEIEFPQKTRKRHD